MMEMKLKLELEKLYKKYCLGELKELKGEEFIDGLGKFVKFRLLTKRL